MHPWDHARSSARRHGGRPQTFLAYHTWFDRTKIARAHFTHRALRHHREGIAEAARVFGPCIANPEGHNVDAETLGLQHLEEDVGCAPSARDWLIHADPDRLPVSWPAAEELADNSARRFGGAPSDYLDLHAWFLETRTWMPDARHLTMRHHAFGVFEAEERFGLVLHTSKRPVPTRVVAERHVRAIMGAIPSGDALLRTIRAQRWMAAATSPSRLGLDRA